MGFPPPHPYVTCFNQGRPEGRQRKAEGFSNETGGTSRGGESHAASSIILGGMGWMGWIRAGVGKWVGQREGELGKFSLGGHGVGGSEGTAYGQGGVPRGGGACVRSCCGAVCVLCVLEAVGGGVVYL